MNFGYLIMSKNEQSEVLEKDNPDATGAPTMQHHQPDEVNTVIVGAGPIGLLNAIGLLNKNPNQKIVMLEKYDDYKRSHTLRVDYKQVEKYLKACGEPPDPAISELLKKTKKSKFIRINEIERLLKQRAIELGAEIITGSGVTDFDEQVRKKYPKADLIIGADGTRSVVSQQAIGKSYAFYEMTDETEMKQDKMYFREKDGQIAYSVITPDGKTVVDRVLPGEQFKAPVDMKKINDMKKDILDEATKNGDVHVEENSEKKEFDFVMQFRYEVEGDASAIPLPTLVRLMQNYGITCDEYVGKKDANGKTPITFQIMITKEQYKLLESHAKSGNPIRPFSGTDQKAGVIPPILLEQVQGYLGLRLRHFTNEKNIVRIDTGTISVNEAPATFAKQVHKRLDNGPDVVVVGDASLGLSYFKGINSAFEASARLLENMSKPYSEREPGLANYRNWFEREFTPSKVNEVNVYSTYLINTAVNAFRVLKFVLGSDNLMRSDVAERTVDLYRGHLAYMNKVAEHAKEMGREVELPKWQHAYEHNGKSLENVLTFQTKDSLPILKHIGKNVTDMAKPYKSTFHVVRDLLTPIRAVSQLIVGALRIASAAPIELVSAVIGLVNPGEKSRMEYLRDCGRSFLAKISEGGARILFGASLAASTVLLPFKMISRGVLTFTHAEPLLIEKNNGMKKLIQQSNELLDNMNDSMSSRELAKAEESSPVVHSENGAYVKLNKLHDISVDVHRKFEKSAARGQNTKVNSEEEHELYKNCINRGEAKDYKAYLALFKDTPQKEYEAESRTNMSL